MITSFKLFEFYRGPHKAIGYKHYQELGFGFLIFTNEEGLKNFKSNLKNFTVYLKRLGIKKVETDIKETIPGLENIKEIKGIGLEFPAINKFEAFSIIEIIGTYFKNKKIPIAQALLITDIENIKTPEEQAERSIDITQYIYRKELGKLAAPPTKSELMNKAYKSTKMGYQRDETH